jgi:CBS domain-containing protein
VKNILEKKGGQVWTVAVDASVREALALMNEKNLGAVLVMDGEEIAGIFSERDYARRSATTGQLGLDQPVRELMSHPVFFVEPEQTVDECMRLMTAKHFRHLPVMDHDRLAGLISIGDVVKQIITEKELTIKGLEHYIAGGNTP